MVPLLVQVILAEGWAVSVYRCKEEVAQGKPAGMNYNRE